LVPELVRKKKHRVGYTIVLLRQDVRHVACDAKKKKNKS